MCVISTAAIIAGASAAASAVGSAAVAVGSAAFAAGSAIVGGLAAASPYIAVASSIYGVASNVAAGKQAKKSADKAQSKADAAAAAYNQMADDQWSNYTKNYQPLVLKQIKEAGKILPAEEFVGPEVAGVTQSATPSLRSGIATLADQGAEPGSGRSRAAVSTMGDAMGAAELGTRLDTRKAVRDLQFNRKLGVVSTGRGIPETVMSGYRTLANQKQQIANAWGTQAGSSFKSAVKSLGIGG